MRSAVPLLKGVLRIASEACVLLMSVNECPAVVVPPITLSVSTP